MCLGFGQIRVLDIGDNCNAPKFRPKIPRRCLSKSIHRISNFIAKGLHNGINRELTKSELYLTKSNINPSNNDHGSLIATH